MDCEKFDSHVIDALYDELDELTSAALKRHMEGCSRCAGIFSGLRATREVGVLPIEEPSDSLEARILDAVATAQKKTPWRRKVLRGLAWAGSHAMRPQLAMAALFFLVIGSSLLLLRAKPGSVAVAPVRVTEHGAPAQELAEATAAPAPMAAPTAPAATAETLAYASAAPSSEPQEIAMLDRKRAEMRGGDNGPADHDALKKEASKDEEGVDPSRAALADARKTRDSSGCQAAVQKYDSVGSKFPGTSAAADAMWEAANCYKAMGDASKAHELFLALKGSDGYRDRAESELAADANANPMNNMQQNRSQQQRIAAAPAAAPPPAPAKPASSDASPGQATQGAKGAAAPAAKKPKAQVDQGFASDPYE